LVSNGNIGFADVNGDNLLDWLYVIYINNTPEIRYQLQNPNGSFGGKTTIATATPQNFLSSSNKKLGDFNGDGKIDILYSSYNSTANTPVYALIKNLGAGNFQVGAPVTGDLYAPYNQLRGRFIDFNNDGKEDVLSGARIFYGQADGTFSRFQIPSAVDGLSTSPAELNGDNNLDVVEVGATYYATIVNDGAGGFTRTVYQQNNPGQVSWKFEDFSGDGKADVYQRRLNSDQGNPKNIFGERLISIKESVCQPSGEMKLNNFEFDRDLDVATWNPNSGNWSSKNARWGFQVDPVTKVFNWGLGSHGDVPAPGDFDGDGITDYSVYRNSTGTWYIRQSTNSAWLVFKFGLGGDIAVPNDYDGGGKTDIAVFRPSDGNWYIWSSETQSFTALHFGATGDKPVPADYDGDGKTDIAVYRPSEGNWYYLKSSDNQFAVFHWGIETDKPVPADYDGDGKADLTIYRDGTWWILRSSNNSPVAVLFGAAGDIPLPVYRNLASADLTYYHRANNSWSSFDNRVFYGFTLGANGDVPVYYGLPNN
jgi:hypothetical protein